MSSTPGAWALAGLLVAGLTARAIATMFVCDDAYISFRYVRNLVEGHGLVFNPGEWVEGYTNFLWVVQLAAVWAVVGVEPPTASVALSLLCTWLTVGVTAWWAHRWAPRKREAATVVMALVLLCSQRSFAVWATGGLETRQYTLFVVLAFAAATVGTLRATALASFALGLAALSRPEGFAVFAVVAPLLLLHRDRHGLRVAAIFGPFAVLAGGLLAFRWTTYGALIPNSVVAKSLGAWPSIGMRYLTLVTVEAALYLLVPLAAVGIVWRARLTRNPADLAGLLCLLGQGAGLVWIGGDHFGFRMLDWWWPVLAVGGATVAARIERPRWGWALVGVATVYSSVLELAHDVGVLTARGKPPNHIVLDTTTAPVLWAVPGLPLLLPAYNSAGKTITRHLVGMRDHNHRWFARDQTIKFQPYLDAREGLDLPSDAVARRLSVGIMPWCMPDLEIIDEHGLTDAVVARTPVSEDWSSRQMAHERFPPPGYLRERGVNLLIRGAVDTVEEGLAYYPFALPIADGVVMPFESDEPEWVEQRFAERGLAFRTSGRIPQRNVLQLGSERWEGTVTVATFEQSRSQWQADDGSRWWIQRGRGNVEDLVGSWLLDTHHPDDGEAAEVEIQSPPFEVDPGQVLVFRVGGAPKGAGVALMAGDAEVATWHGQGARKLRFVWVDLTQWAGQYVRVRAFDRNPKRHILLDHVVLLDPAHSHP